MNDREAGTDPPHRGLNEVAAGRPARYPAPAPMVRPSSLSLPRLALGLALLAVLLLHASLFWLDDHPTPRQPVGDELRYLAKAETMLSGRPVELDLLWPPLYPRFLALLLASGSPGLAIGAQTLLLALTALLIWDLARLLGASPAGAALAGLLVVGYPPLAAYTHTFWPEVLHLAFFVAALWVLARRPSSRPWLAALGVVLGLAVLTKNLLMGFLPVVLAALAWKRSRREGLTAIALVLAMTALTITPTLIVNYRQSGRLVIADSSRFNLWLGLSSLARRSRTDREVGEAYRDYMTGADNYPERNRLLMAKVRSLVERRGALTLLRKQFSQQYFRLLDKDSALTDQLPGGVLARRGRGYQDAPRWLAVLLRTGSYALYALLLAAFPVGLALQPPRGRPWLWTIAAFFAYCTVLFFFMHSIARYAVPMLPLFALFAGPALTRLASDPRGTWQALSRRQVWLVGIAVAVLEGLAFTGPYLD